MCDIYKKLPDIASQSVALKRGGDESTYLYGNGSPKRARSSTDREPLSPRAPVTTPLPSPHVSGLPSSRLIAHPLPSSTLSNSAPLSTPHKIPFPPIDTAPNCPETQSEIARPVPFEILLGDLANYASPPDLSIINTRRNVD